VGVELWLVASLGHVAWPRVTFTLQICHIVNDAINDPVRSRDGFLEFLISRGSSTMRVMLSCNSHISQRSNISYVGHYIWIIINIFMSCVLFFKHTVFESKPTCHMHAMTFHT
jgi:hypothetical protein